MDEHAGQASSQNWLIIHGLYVTPEQEEAFARTITRLARERRAWTDIVFIPHAEMEEWARAAKRTGTAALLARFRARLGLSGADEIYSSRNWLFGNELLFNAYRGARTICYGDGIGLFFTPGYAAPTVSRRYFASLHTLSVHERPLTLLRSLKHRLEIGLNRRTKLREVPFDEGYFLYPELFGEYPP